MIGRLCFSALLVLALLPASVLERDPRRTAELSQQTFCERNPHTCGAFGEMWDGMKLKASLAAGHAIAFVQSPGGEQFEVGARSIEPVRTTERAVRESWQDLGADVWRQDQRAANTSPSRRDAIE